LHFVPYSLVAVHTWLLVLEPDLAYVMCQQSAGRCPYLGNTPVSLFSYVHSDICPKYTLGISQGCSLGSELQFHAHASLSQEFSRPPSTYVHASRAGLLPSTRRKERLALRNSYQDILDHLDFTCMYGAGLLACSPSGGGLGRRTAERAGCCPLRWGSWAVYSSLLGTFLGPRI
jgi:hypothetical protein